jgi:hypothetical protein
VLSFKIRNVEYNLGGRAQEHWQAALHIQATFSVLVDDGVVVEQPYWAIVEQAESLAAWLGAVTDAGPDYSYTSMDDDQHGILTFSRTSDGLWVVGSAWQEFESRAVYLTPDLVSACRQYIGEALESARQYMSPALYKKVCSSVCG